MRSANPRHQVSWLTKAYLVGPLSRNGFIQKFWHREYWDGCRFFEDLWTSDVIDHGSIISPSKQLVVLLLIFAVYGKNAMSDMCVIFMVSMFFPSKLTLLALTSHWYCPSHPFWHILEQCSKAVVIKCLYISGYYEWKMYQTSVCLSTLYYRFHWI